MSINKLRVFETFSGIGAQHKALEIIKNKFNFDYEIVATSEWDVDACIAYAAIHYPNFEKSIKLPKDKNEVDEYLKSFSFSFTGKEPALLKRVLSLDKEKKYQLYKAHIASKNIGSIVDIKGKELINKVQSLDLITYSFPCQDLSVAGSFWGFNKGMKEDSETRSSLLWEIGRLVTELSELKKLPNFLLLENVPNMVSTRHVNDYIIWKKHLLKYGYKTITYVINARNFGVPQNRKRVYAISILDPKNKININEQLEIIDSELFPNQSLLKLPKEIKKISLKDVIKENYNIEKYRVEALAANPNRTPSREKMFNLNYKLNDFNKYKYSRTLTTKQDRHPNTGVIDLRGTILEPTTHFKVPGRKAKYRFVTTREAYLLMGFDEKDYENVSKNNIRRDKLYQQAGNSIVVSAILVILKLIQEINNVR